MPEELRFTVDEDAGFYIKHQTATPEQRESYIAFARKAVTHPDTHDSIKRRLRAFLDSIDNPTEGGEGGNDI